MAEIKWELKKRKDFKRELNCLYVSKNPDDVCSVDKVMSCQLKNMDKYFFTFGSLFAHNSRQLSKDWDTFVQIRTKDLLIFQVDVQPIISYPSDKLTLLSWQKKKKVNIFKF